MRSKKMKAFALAAMAGTLLQFGGCLGGDFLQRVAANVVADQVSGAVGGVFDISTLLGGLTGTATE